MSEIFHQFLTSGWKADVLSFVGKFLSVGKRSFLTHKEMLCISCAPETCKASFLGNQKSAKQISQFMLKNHLKWRMTATFHNSLNGGF